MEKVTIIYDSRVVDYLNQLALILFTKDYFSYLENAVKYKNDIIDFIYYNIALFRLEKRQYNCCF